MDRFYNEAHARLTAWRAVLANPRNADTDFAFLPGYIARDDLKWAIDPLVVLPDFQEWAKAEVIERRVTTANEDLGEMRPDFYMTSSPELNLGRLLAAQIVGIEEIHVARGYCKDSNAGPLIQHLLDSGLDPNLDHHGETLLHSAAWSQNGPVAQVLLDAGADPNAECEGKTPLAYSRESPIKAEGATIEEVLCTAMGKAPRPKANSNLVRDLISWPAVTKQNFEGTASRFRIETLTEGDLHITDLCEGSPPVHVAPSTHWASDLTIDPTQDAYLIVEGDLDVDGLLQLEGADPHLIVVVTGSLQARALVVRFHCQLFVLGDVSLERGAVFALADSGGARFAGAFSSPAIFSINSVSPEFGHNTQVEHALPQSMVVDGLPDWNAITNGFRR